MFQLGKRSVPKKCSKIVFQKVSQKMSQKSVKSVYSQVQPGNGEIIHLYHADNKTLKDLSKSDNLDIQGLQDFDNYNCNALPHLFWSYWYFLCQMDKRTIGCDLKSSLSNSVCCWVDCRISVSVALINDGSDKGTIVVSWSDTIPTHHHWAITPTRSRKEETKFAK